MKSVDLICHWVREHEWGEQAWCCATEESHTCSVLHGGDPVQNIKSKIMEALRMVNNV